MSTFSSYDQVGAKEDVSDLITNLSPTKTPFSTLIGSETVTQIVHQWQEDALAAVQSNAQVEGANAVVASQNPTTMRSNNTQILMDTASVSGTVQVVKTYGRDGEMAYQMMKKSAQLKRNLEYAFVGTGQSAVLGNDATARQMAGYQAQIDPAGVVAVGGALTETAIVGLLETLYVNGSDPDYIMVKPNDSLKIADFVANNGRQKRIDNSDKKIVNVVDVYVSPFGEQKVVLNRFLNTSNALVFEAGLWKKLVLRNWFRETLAKVGDSLQIQIVGEFSLKHKNFFGSGLLTGLSA